MNLQRYEDWSPTGFDAAGYGLGSTIDDERAGWLVAPCILTRDSGALERANWDTVTRSLLESDAGDDVELLEFGHWACGWFSVYICRPDSPAAIMAQEWATRLAGYPVADEEALAREELEEAGESWADWGRDDWRRALEREHAGLDLSEAEDAALDSLWTLARGMTEHGGDGPRFHVEDAAGRLTRADLLAAGAVEVDA